MKTYTRIGCKIIISDVAEELFKFKNINIDRFANHLFHIFNEYILDYKKEENKQEGVN